MIIPHFAQVLLDLGFTDGWSLFGDELVLWEHDQDPPSPLVRPQEATDEADTTDA